MHAAKGDRIVVQGKRVGDPDRVAVILKVEGTDSAPAYRVRWDNGHEALYFPGSDARVEHQSTRR